MMGRLSNNADLLRCFVPAVLTYAKKYAALLETADALHLDILGQPARR